MDGRRVPPWVVRAGIFLVGAAAAAAADLAAPKKAPPVARTAIVEPPSPSMPYPRGRWRLAPAELNGVVMSLQRILVSHSGARLRQPWTRKTRRGLQEAREQAEEMGRILARAPGEFETLARERSDDVRTARYSGDLGVVSATSLPEEVLDALAAMSVGQVSRAFETPEGFEIVAWHPPPSPMNVAASRLVVKYAGASPIGRHPERYANRSFDEALAMADDLARRGAANPVEFEKLVEDASEDFDPTGGGDIGVVSVIEGDSSSFAAHVISKLEAGAVSGPVVDTDGISVYRRTARLDRKRVASRDLVFRVDEETTQEAARQHANSALRLLLLGRPFEQVAKEVCEEPRCVMENSAWQVGRGFASFERALQAVPEGRFVRATLQSPSGYHVVQRVRPDSVPEPSPKRFDLPRPDFRPLEFFVEQASIEELEAGVATLLHEVAQKLSLSKSNEHEFDRIRGDLVRDLRASRTFAERMAAVTAAHASIERALGADRYAAYRAAETKWLDDLQLK